MRSIQLLCCALLIALGNLARADVQFIGSGFLTVAAGQMLGGTRDGVLTDYRCPCFISDYAQGGVYEDKGGLQWKPDSKLGLQGSMVWPGQDLHLTGQIVARGARDGNVNLEWLYGSWQIDDRFTLQLGRKRLPLFYYSDSQDIGLALPWVHLPPQLYGWEAVNFNGANLLYRDDWDGTQLTASVLAGKETIRDAGMWQMTTGRRARTDVRWQNITGGYLALARNGYEARLSHISARTSSWTRNAAWNWETGEYDASLIDADWQDHGRQKFTGLALTVDRTGWLLRAEAVRVDYPQVQWRDWAYILAIGHRFGRWQPMLTHARYKAVPTGEAGGPAESYSGHSLLALTLRYDLDDKSAFKIQFDRQRDESGPWARPTKGHARLLTIAYDRAF